MKKKKPVLEREFEEECLVYQNLYINLVNSTVRSNEKYKSRIKKLQKQIKELKLKLVIPEQHTQI